jgi:putative tryptophan/tyrosine transport system substrate-binding protein
MASLDEGRKLEPVKKVFVGASASLRIRSGQDWHAPTSLRRGSGHAFLPRTRGRMKEGVPRVRSCADKLITLGSRVEAPTTPRQKTATDNQWPNNAGGPVRVLWRLSWMVLVLLAPILAHAQPRVPRLGIVIPELARPQSQVVKGLADELNKLGYQERKGIVLETRNVKGNRAALQPAALELIGQKVDVIFTTGTRATQVVQSATKDIPIVFVHPADPVSLGLVKSMDGSNGNLTGVAGLAAQMTDKRLAILKEILPELQRVHIFFDSNNKFSRANFALAESAATKMALQPVAHAVKSVEELKSTVSTSQYRQGDALFHVPDDLVESEADFIFETARQKKLPTMFNEELWAIKGAMAAHGPSYYEMGRQAARLVDMILKGNKPESLPIQRASKFDLILNYRTASFIGVTLSRDVLKKADKVIR